MLAVTNPTPFVVGGLVNGAAFAVAAVGLVLAYRVSRTVNLAQGAVGMFAVYLYWQVHTEWGLPTPVAIAIAGVAFPVVLALMCEALVFRRLGDASVFAKTAATVGILLALTGAATHFWGTRVVSLDPLFPTSGIRIAGTEVRGDQIGVVMTSLVLGGAAFAFLRFTRAGLLVRAVVDRAELAAERGVDIRRVNRQAWVLNYVFGAAVGLLVGPGFRIIQPFQLTLLVVFALVAAAIGRMASLPLAVGGAFAVALIDSLAVGYAPPTGLTSNVRGFVPFSALIIAVLWHARSTREVERDEDEATASLADAVAGGTGEQLALRHIAAVVVACGAVAAAGGRYWTDVLANGVSYAVIFLSVTFFTSTTGLVSLATAAFGGLGVFAAAALLVGGLPWPVAVAGGIVVAGVAGALVALPTVRLRGVYLVLATIAFAQLVENRVYTTGLTGDGFSGRPFARPAMLEGTVAYLGLVVGSFTAVAWATIRIRRSRIGRSLQADLASGAAARSIGIRPERGRLIAFAGSAAIAALGACLLSGVTSFAAVGLFTMFANFVWLALVAIGGVGSVWGALVAGLVMGVTPDVASNVPVLQRLFGVLFGFGALVFLRSPGGLAGLVRRSAAGLAAARARTGSATAAEHLAPLRPSVRAAVVSGVADEDGPRRRRGSEIQKDEPPSTLTQAPLT